jgi:osmotically-inducible protein OsmY
MGIRKFIEEIGEKVLPPARRNIFPAQAQQQQSSSPGPRPRFGSMAGGVAITEAAEAIRRHLLSRRDFTAPSDLAVFFDEVDGVVILGGTVREQRTRELIVQAAGNIQGVEIVDDRMTKAKATCAPPS